MSILEYCPGCDDVVAAGEPCQCVFVARGTIDAQGVLHTARRLPLDNEPAEFPFGEFDDGAHWRLPAPAPELSQQDWLTERGGEPEDWITVEELTGEDSEIAHLAILAHK